MRSGYNPSRRNRKIGTAAHGYGQDNELVIPSLLHGERRWAETLKSFKAVTESVSGRKVTFIVENPSPGSDHCCSILDVCHVLKHIPFDDWHGLTTFVFRQPTRKQRIIAPVWGRLFYSADFGSLNRNLPLAGPTIILEAVRAGETFKWGKGLRPQDAHELERLRSDGHGIVSSARQHLITTTAESVRSTQLFRTLLHEIGHWVDFLAKVERAKGDYGELIDQYFARPHDEREAFAHRYADETFLKLFKSGIFPFDPIQDWDEP